LVIVNDRYGVKINKVIAEAEDMPMSRPKPAQQTPDAENRNSLDEQEEGEYEEQEEEYNEEEYEQGSSNEPGAGGEDEFDYSDFDLEDDNI
jgi:ribosomal protein L12E/L44/L45/RPP1/RPP2